MEEKIRAFDLDGTRRQIRLDTCTWEVIDLLAKMERVKWAELARKWAQENPTDAKGNLTATVRAGAMTVMLKLQTQHVEAAATATATAAAATKPGTVRIDWATAATHGAFFLNPDATDYFLKTLQVAQRTALIALLEATGPSEEDREYQRMDEREAERKAELKEEEDAERSKEEKKAARIAEYQRVDREEEERLESEKSINPKE